MIDRLPSCASPLACTRTTPPSPSQEENAILLGPARVADLAPIDYGVPSRRQTPVELPLVDPLLLTHAEVLHRAGYTGKGQVVAILDSGYNHPEVPLVAFHDVLESSPIPVDPFGHGTYVAGAVHQVAPDAGLVAVRVLDHEGQVRPEPLIEGIRWAVENRQKYGITVINLSVNQLPQGQCSWDNPLDLAVEDAISKGITVVTAAGNAGPEGGTIGPPGDDPVAITVGSGLDETRVSDFSSRGPTDNGLHKPDVMAPGEFVTSWSAPGSAMDEEAKFVETIRHASDEKLVRAFKLKPKLIELLRLPPDILERTPEDRLALVQAALPPIYRPDDGHIAEPGTSIAAPLVAGIIADLREARPTLTPAQAKDLLKRTAQDMGRSYGPDDQGFGFVNAAAALEALCRPSAASGDA